MTYRHCSPIVQAMIEVLVAGDVDRRLQTDRFQSRLDYAEFGTQVRKECSNPLTRKIYYELYRYAFDQ